MGTSWDTIGGILIAWDNESMMFIVIIIFIFNYYCIFFLKLGIVWSIMRILWVQSIMLV